MFHDCYNNVIYIIFCISDSRHFQLGNDDDDDDDDDDDEDDQNHDDNDDDDDESEKTMKQMKQILVIRTCLSYACQSVFLY